LKRGTKIRVRSPLILYRVCGGDAHAFIARKGDFVTIRLERYHCLHRARNTLFCNLHRASEYSKYLDAVFREPHGEPGTSLAKLPHLVYLLHIGGRHTKVGITNIVKNVRRLAEQPFLNAVILAVTDSLLQARRIEIALSKLSDVTDRMRVDERLRRLREHASSIKAELHELAHTILFSIVPRIRTLGIDVSVDKPIPVISVSERIRKIYSSTPQATKAAISSLEGVGEVLDYVPGALLVSINGRDLLMPYQYLRDHMLNLDVVS